MPRRGENFESVLLVSEDFNEESARKAGGLSLVPTNISILIRVTESFVFSLEYCTCSTPIALTAVEIRRKGWLKFGLMEIDWPTFHTAWLIKTETFVSVVCKLQSGSNFGQLIKKSFRWTGSEPQQGRTGSKGERITLEGLTLWNCHYCFAKKPSFLRIFLVSLWKRFSKDNVRLCMLFFRDNYGGNSHFSEKTLL